MSTESMEPSVSSFLGQHSTPEFHAAAVRWKEIVRALVRYRMGDLNSLVPEDVIDKMTTATDELMAQRLIAACNAGPRIPV